MKESDIKSALILRQPMIVLLMRTIKGMPLKLQVILCTFMEAQLQELEPKRCKLLLNGLIEKIWIENEIQDARHHELGLKRRQGIVGIIQVIGQPNTQFVSNAERSHSE